MPPPNPQTLTEESIPDPTAPWILNISEFALAFDGYQALGDRLGELANATERGWSERGELPDGLIELRACLFYEQRRYRHFGRDPYEDEMEYIRALVEAIRAQVAEAGGNSR